MNNNDIFRRLRYALKISDAGVVRLFKMVHHEVAIEDLPAWLAKTEDPQFKELDDATLELFLDGYILFKRGPRQESSKQAAPTKKPTLSNNQILRKLKIALQLRDDDFMAIMERAQFQISKPELSALFRNPNHPKYKACGNQFLRNFLNGLTAHLRD